MAEGWRMWAISLLTILLLFPFLSAAPLNIAGDIKDDNDRMHSHDENVTRGGKFFGHNQFDMGDMNISGSVVGDVVSIGHQVNIDVHGHTHNHHHHEADTECKEGLRVLFKSIDSNKNGLMDAKELLRVCHQNNFQITESSAVRILTLPDKTVGFNMAKFCELLKDCQSTNSVDIIYFLLQLYDRDEADCSCNGHLDEHGEGECKTDWPQFSKQFWCYVKKGSCSDAEEWRGNYWSYEACLKGSLILPGLLNNYHSQWVFDLNHHDLGKLAEDLTNELQNNPIIEKVDALLSITLTSVVQMVAVKNGWKKECHMHPSDALLLVLKGKFYFKVQASEEPIKLNAGSQMMTPQWHAHAVDHNHSCKMDTSPKH